jgi:hypothetical protein
MYSSVIHIHSPQLSYTVHICSTVIYVHLSSHIQYISYSNLRSPQLSYTVHIEQLYTFTSALIHSRYSIVIVRDTAQESEMNALGSYLFHDVVNQT